MILHRTAWFGNKENHRIVKVNPLKNNELEQGYYLLSVFFFLQMCIVANIVVGDFRMF